MLTNRHEQRTSVLPNSEDRIRRNSVLKAGAVVLGLVVLITGCGHSAASTSSDGAASTDMSAKLPADFPKDVTIPSGVRITMATPVNNGPSVGFQVAFDSSDTTGKIIAALKNGLTENGWSVNQVTTLSPQLTSMGATKATERRELNVQIVDADGKRSVTETVMGVKP